MAKKDKNNKKRKNRKKDPHFHTGKIATNGAEFGGLISCYQDNLNLYPHCFKRNIIKINFNKTCR